MAAEVKNDRFYLVPEAAVGAGKILCEECRDKPDVSGPVDWCEHIEMLILTRNDFRWMPKEGIVTFPLFPSADIWANALLRPTKVEGLRTVDLLVPSVDSRMREGIPIGSVTATEGRAALRTLALVWIASQPDEAKKCKKKSHNRYQTVKWYRNLVPGSKERLIEDWYGITEESCSRCAKPFDASEDAIGAVN